MPARDSKGRFKKSGRKGRKSRAKKSGAKRRSSRKSHISTKVAGAYKAAFKRSVKRVAVAKKRIRAELDKL
jgi:hypothetical protein